MSEAVSPKIIETEDRLIDLKEVAQRLGLNYRSVLEARVQRRFLLAEVRPSPRCIRVRLSDVLAVLRGEKTAIAGQAFDPAKKKQIHEKQKEKRAAAKKAGGAT
jgi:hypothetical protein